MLGHAPTKCVQSDRAQDRRATLDNKPRIVNLDDETGINDGALLLAHGVRIGLSEVSLRLIELVFHAGDRRSSGNECFTDVDTLQRRSQILNVLLDRGLPDVGDWSRAHQPEV